MDDPLTWVHVYCFRWFNVSLTVGDCRTTPSPTDGAPFEHPVVNWSSSTWRSDHPCPSAPWPVSSSRVSSQWGPANAPDTVSDTRRSSGHTEVRRLNLRARSSLVYRVWNKRALKESFATVGIRLPHTQFLDWICFPVCWLLDSGQVHGVFHIYGLASEHWLGY